MNLRQTRDVACGLAPDISKRSFEEAVECVLSLCLPPAWLFTLIG
jgi:hypothetical protein